MGKGKEMASDIIKKRNICIKLHRENNHSWEWLLSASKKEINYEFDYLTKEEGDKPLEYWVKTVLGKEKK